MPKVIQVVIPESVMNSASDIARNYDQYFASHLYDKRYPGPNPSSLAIVMREIAQGQEQTTFCGLCGVSKTSTAAECGRWFKRHEQTARHRRALARFGRRRG